MTDKPTRVSDICLATVCTEEFLSGSLVMIYSFLKHNPWFKGDIVVIHADLKSEHRKSLTSLYDRIQFLSVSSQLQNCLNKLLISRSELANRKARFYSLEALRLTDYAKVLFCDSDILFRQSVKQIFETPKALICCGDGSHYLGKYRDSSSFLSHSGESDEADRNLSQTFNAGFMLFNFHMLDKRAYTGLLALLTEETWDGIKAAQTDQVVFNLYFNGRQTILDGSYNFLLNYHNAIKKREGTQLIEAKVIHFNGPNKPWLINRLLDSGTRDPVLIQALKFWYEDYIECLTKIHFRKI